MESSWESQQKFDKLRSARNTKSLDPKRVVRNVSSRILTEDEERLLALVLNFAVTPRRIPYHEIIAATESTARQLDAEKAKKLREGVAALSSKPDYQQATSTGACARQ